ncbi:MAG TPA: response regulator [Chloroflexi bacterium]|nr:response regulator [Chloroflexota bacterium]HAL27257.1 response regulator [Chloroflexota bacterium]
MRNAACMAGRMVTIERRGRPILIVDDDRDILAAERAVLAEGGYAVREAHNGAEALVALDVDPPAMIVLDVQMPGIDGPTFARELRNRLRHVPLVILTAAPDPKREADRCNAEAYLAKPFRAEDLLQLVRRFST